VHGDVRRQILGDAQARKERGALEVKIGGLQPVCDSRVGKIDGRAAQTIGNA
jgi:hypothetical protein